MKRVFFIVICLVSLFIIKNLVSSIYNLWQKQDLVVQAEKELDKEREKNKKLKDEIARVESPQFIEEQARNKLFMVKEGEQAVLLPQKISSSSADLASPKPNWQKWFELFFK